MSLVICAECGKEKSDSANQCPHCGYKAKTNRGLWMLWLITTCLIVGVALMRGGSNYSAKPDVHDIACVAAVNAIMTRLKAPSSASFPSCYSEADQYEIHANPDRSVISIIGHVDAQNSFGAKLRKQYVVFFNTNGNAESYAGWSIQKIAIN